MIPILSRNHRVIAMDFIGFGRSDKFTERDDYSFQMHADTLKSFIHTLGLGQITLVVQDWGGLVGLTMATQMRARFARLVIMNTGLPTGGFPMSSAFIRWQHFAEGATDLHIARSIVTGMAPRD